jgi:hypothetical protein
MSHSDPQGAVRAFEAKATSLIAATRSLDIPRILLLRRLTLSDPESRKWASEKQLNVVFSVILSKAAERLGPPALKTARERGFEGLLPNDPTGRGEDLRVLSDIVAQLIGPPDLSEAASTCANFQSLMSRDYAKAPLRVMRTLPPVREPPPLFAAQLGPAIDRRVARALPPPVIMAAAESESAPPAIVEFPVLFDETLCTYVHKT